MKTLYLFCHCIGEITTDTVFFRVPVGTNKQDQRDASFLRVMAQSSDFLFIKYDDAAVAYMQKLNSSLFDDGRFHLPTMQLSIREIVRLVRSQVIDEFSKSFLKHFRGCLKMSLNENHAFIAARDRALESSCNAAHVKNLSALP